MTAAKTQYEAISKAAAKIARGETHDAVYNVIGSAEENYREGVEYGSDEYYTDIMSTICCNLCDGVGGEKAAKWFIKNGVRF